MNSVYIGRRAEPYCLLRFARGYALAALADAHVICNTNGALPRGGVT